MEKPCEFEELLQKVNDLNDKVRTLEEKDSRNIQPENAHQSQEVFKQDDSVAEVRTHSRRKTACIIWGVFIVFCLSIQTYRTVILVQAYLEYSTHVRYVLNERSDVSLPDITVCNLNPVKMSRLKENPGLNALYRNITAGKPSKKKVLTSYAEYQTFLDGYRQLPVTERRLLGYQSADTFFRELHEFKVERKTITTYDYGNCFTDSIQSSQRRPGYKFGYRVALNIDIGEYVRPGSNQGATLYIHEPGTQTPLNDDIGFTIRPGQTGYINVRPRLVSRLGEPYGICHAGNVKGKRGGYSDYSYSAMKCRSDCVREKMARRCGCVSASHVTLIDVDVAAWCGESDIGRTNCTREFLHVDGCNCPFPCEETMYRPSFVVNTDGENSGDSLCSDTAIMSKFSSAMECKSFVGANIAIIHLYMGDFSVEEITEIPELTLAGMIEFTVTNNYPLVDCRCNRTFVNL